MLTNIRNFAIVLFASAVLAFGQGSYTLTTLSNAVTADASQSILNVASATNINAPALPFSQGGIGSPSAAALTLIMVDNELFRVNGVSGTQVSVERGYNGTGAQAHAASAKVWVGPASYFTGNEPAGPCVATAQPVAPRIVFSGGPLGRKARAWNCGNSVWGTFDGYAPSEGATIASTTTIAPTNSMHVISGTAAVVTVTVPPACLVSNLSICKVTLVPTGAFTTTTAGNILHASTAVIGIAMELTYQPSTAKWATSY